MSLLQRFVSGMRQVMALQLILAILAVAVAGWTLGLTNELLRERDRLRDRIVQLEETLVANNVVVPSTVTVVDTPTRQRARVSYPPSIDSSAPQAAESRGFNPGQIIGDLFTPAPPMRTLVLHARGDADARAAQMMADELARAGEVEVRVALLPPRDPRAAGYSYFDGRQSRRAAELVQIFHDTARRYEVAAWSGQLRGVALPAQGEYAADRMDIVLPPLPAAQAQRFAPAPAEAETAPAAAPQ